MKKWLRRLLQGILLMIMAFSLIEVGSYLWERQHSNTQLNAVNDQVSDLIDGSAKNKPDASSELVDYSALMDRLKAMNEDTVAYIEIQGSENRYPVLQAADNDYYLRRGIDKQYSIQGIPFMDYRNKKELTDQNTIIYAHMMYYGDEMFGVLKHFTDQKYVDQSPKTVTLTTDQGVFTYRLFSIEHVGATDPYRIPNKPGDEFMGDMLAAYAASEADFDLSAEFNEKDRIITLSTCTTDQDESERIAVLGVLEKVETKEGTVTREEIQRAYKN